MSIEGVLMILLWIVLIFAIGWLAHWIITTYLPEPVRTPALMIVGIVLLIVVILLLVRTIPGGSGARLGMAPMEKLRTVFVNLRY